MSDNRVEKGWALFLIMVNWPSSRGAAPRSLGYRRLCSPQPEFEVPSPPGSSQQQKISSGVRELLCVRRPQR